MARKENEPIFDPLARLLAVRDQRRAHASSADEPARPALDQTPGASVEYHAASRRGVHASVIFDQQGTTLRCPLVELSLQGAMFSTGGQPTHGIEFGTRHVVTLVDESDVKVQVDVVARVMRCVGETFALEWAHAEGSRERLAAFLETLLRNKPPDDDARQAELAAIEGRLEAAAMENTHPQSRAARVVVSVNLLIEHGGKSEELVLLNVSRTGGLAASAGAALSRLRAGTLVMLSLARSDHPEISVPVLARVIRHDGHATAIDWSEDRAAEYEIARLLDQLVSQRPG
jgi:hypothetical protein